MVNIKYFINGQKVLENEYNSTSFNNFNDIIKHLKKEHIYKICITRHYEKGGHSFYKQYYLVLLDQWQLFELDGRKNQYDTFASTAHISSKWKIYFNEMPALKYIHLDEIVSATNEIKRSYHFIDKNTDLTKLTSYTDYIVECENIVLNNEVVHYLRYDNLNICNIIVKKIKISQPINAYSYGCSVM